MAAGSHCRPLVRGSLADGARGALVVQKRQWDILEQGRHHGFQLLRREQTNGASLHASVSVMEEKGGDATHLELLQLLFPEGVFHVEQHQIQRAPGGSV